MDNDPDEIDFTVPPRTRPAPSRIGVFLVGLAVAFIVIGFAVAFNPFDNGDSPNSGLAFASGRSQSGGPNLVIVPEVQKDGEPFTATPTPTLTPTPVPTPTPTPLPLPRTAAGLKAWSQGDSTSYFMTVSVLSLLADQGAIPVHAPDYVISSGLVSGTYDWPARLAYDMSTLDPDIVVFMIGANDAVVRPNLDTYAATVGAVMDSLQREGRVVAWVGQPIMDPATRPELNEVIPGLNAVYAAEAAKRPWVKYVDAWSLTTDANGNYASALPDENGVVQQIRAGDGVHLTSAGGRRIALGVIATLFPQ